MRVLAAYRGILFVRVWNAPISSSGKKRKQELALLRNLRAFSTSFKEFAYLLELSIILSII